MIRAVFFDLDDTLFDHQHCARAALAGVRDAHPCFAGIAPEEVERHHGEILEDLHLQVMSGRLPLDAARIERFRRLYAAVGHEAEEALVAQTASAYRQHYIRSRREVTGATALLAEVRKHAQVVIVSNNLLEEQQDKLRHCGLDRYVDVLVVSEEAGVSKPDPKIFEIALERAGCTAAEAVMVGDSWTNDIGGAIAAGIRPVWFSRHGRQAPDPEVEVITSFEPVPDVLRRILAL